MEVLLDQFPSVELFFHPPPSPQFSSYIVIRLVSELGSCWYDENTGMVVLARLLNTAVAVMHES